MAYRIFSIKMTCQAYGCSTRSSHGISLHTFPDPAKKKELYQTWMVNLNLTPATFTHNKFKKVCADHFEASCFDGNLMGRLIGFTPRHRRLKSDAVPTLFAYNQGLRDDDSNSHTRKRVLLEIPLPIANGVNDNRGNSVMTESKEFASDQG